MNILIIEDNQPLSEVLKLSLQDAQHSVVSTDTGIEAIDLVRTYEFDAVLLDVGLPDMSGQELISRLRRKGYDLPILAMSGEDELALKLDCLAKGADDFLAKPFHLDELLARILTVVRRTKGHASSMICAGALKIDLGARAASIGAKAISLTKKEFQLLEILSLRKGQVLSKGRLLDLLYGGVDEPEPKIIDVFTCRLRKKLEKASGRDDWISTVYGEGYMLSA